MKVQLETTFNDVIEEQQGFTPGGGDVHFISYESDSFIRESILGFERAKSMNMFPERPNISIERKILKLEDNGQSFDATFVIYDKGEKRQEFNFNSIEEDKPRLNLKKIQLALILRFDDVKNAKKAYDDLENIRCIEKDDEYKKEAEKCLEILSSIKMKKKDYESRDGFFNSIKKYILNLSEKWARYKWDNIVSQAKQ